MMFRTLTPTFSFQTAEFVKSWFREEPDMSSIALMGESDFYDNIIHTSTTIQYIIYRYDHIFLTIIFAALFAMNDENAVGK